MWVGDPHSLPLIFRKPSTQGPDPSLVVDFLKIFNGAGILPDTVAVPLRVRPIAPPEDPFRVCLGHRPNVSLEIVVGMLEIGATIWRRELDPEVPIPQSSQQLGETFRLIPGRGAPPLNAFPRDEPQVIHDEGKRKGRRESPQSPPRFEVRLLNLNAPPAALAPPRQSRRRGLDQRDLPVQIVHGLVLEKIQSRGPDAGGVIGVQQVVGRSLHVQDADAGRAALEVVQIV